MSRALERLTAPEARKLIVLGALAAKAKREEAQGSGRVLEFASTEHERFYRSRAPELVASAWMGAGKSRILCQKAWDLALEYPGAELALFRKVGASLAATTERTFFADVAVPHLIVERNRTERWVEVGTRGRTSRIWLLGLDTDPGTGVPSKVGSLNLDWAGVDEAVELTEGDWIMLGGRLRRTAMPFRQLAAATNPAAPSHWLKRHFSPPRDGQEWIALEANRFLPADYRERLAAMGSGYQAQRLAQGLWVAAEGTIWFLPDGQVREPEQAVWQTVVGGIDWGFNHAFAAEIVGRTGSGRLATIDELYGRGHLVSDLIPKLLQLQEQYKVERFYADPSEPEYIAQCQRAGLRITGAVNDILPGIDAVSAAIAAGETVSPRCTGLLGELPAYVWARDRSGDARERPVESGDDACDAWRYAHMGLLRPEPGILEYYRMEAARLAKA